MSLRRWRGLLALVLMLTAAWAAPSAHADGDPGSDVLVYQPLYLGSDAGVSISQQARLDGLLRAAARSGAPIRVAIVASRYDLGSVTGLWLKPRDYARFLGLELSLAYRGRLLVVMPNGLGFSWLGHSPDAAYQSLSGIAVSPGGAGLAAAAQRATRVVAAAAAVKLAPAPAASAPAPPPAPASAPIAAPSNSVSPLLVLLFVALAAAAAFVVISVARRARPRTALYGLGLAAAMVIAVAAVALIVGGGSGSIQNAALAGNPELDPGTSLSGPAPSFTLTDQFGRPVSLRAFRGKVVILAFNDSQCTTICPLATTAMLQAKRMLGSAGHQVQLLGIDANPRATSLDDVLSYSQLHGLTREWHFLTGTRAELGRVWKAYSIGVQIDQGQVDHSPAVFVINPSGQLAKLYVTQQSYAAVDQFGQILATETSSLLPNHPPVRSSLSYTQIAGLPPTQAVTAPRVGGGTVRLGPGSSPRLYLFFASWDEEVTSLSGHLAQLDQYAGSTASSGLPALTAVDEASVEPSSSALTGLLHGLHGPLTYPLAIDSSGRIADGYQVQGQPWFVLTSSSGQILWSWAVNTSGWPTPAKLVGHIRAALTRGPAGPTSALGAQQELAGSPPPLASLHQQAGQLLGSQTSLAARIRALRGYPIVVNAWASWCAPCQAEFGLFATASAHLGRQTAFLGVDTDDSPSDAQSFLAGHPVSYPSYQSTTGDLRTIVPQGVVGLPTTLFINRAGKLVYVHSGQYQSQGALDGDVESYGS